MRVLYFSGGRGHTAMTYEKRLVMLVSNDMIAINHSLTSYSVQIVHDLWQECITPVYGGVVDT